jgi:PQQ-like domain
VNTTERQLSDLLHRITPEPPRGVTVEDVATRMANPAGRRPRVRRTFRGSPGRRRTWAPALAAASVFAVAGASAGIAVLATSHRTPSPGTALNTISASRASSPGPSSSPAHTPASTYPPTAIPDAPWHARLIVPQAVTQGSLISGDNSLYAIGSGTLDRIDPATGTIVRTTPYRSPVMNPPVLLGDTVWVVWTYSGGNIVLHGYDAQTLAQVASVAVPAAGGVSSTAQGVLTAGPDGHLYLAAGDQVAVVDPGTSKVVRQISLVAGPASSVAVSADGKTLYVGSQTSSSFALFSLDLSSGTESGPSKMSIAGVGGNLIATSGGVWGTLGTGMTEWAWFAPGGHVSRAIRVGPGASGGFASIPTLSGDAVWIGGSQTLACADPSTGRVLDSAAIPTDQGTAEYFGSVATASGQAYADYQNQAAQQYGVARMIPPAACTGGGGS